MEHRQSFLSQIKIFILIGLTLIAAVISLWVWENVEHEIQKDLSSTASLLDKYYELSFYQRELGLASVGYRLLDITGEKQDSLRHLFAIKSLNNYHELLAFGLADTTGQLITFTGAKPGEPYPNLTKIPESKRSFLDAKGANGLAIGEVYYSKTINNWVIPIRIPLKDDSGKLIAINTSGIDYGRMINNLRSFDFNPNYKIHIINNIYNITQLYHPLHTTQFDLVLRQSATIYEDFSSINLASNQEIFSAFNKIEKTKVIGVKTKPGSFDHYLIISVDRNVLIEAFIDQVVFVALVYVLLVISTLIGFKYLKRKETSHLVELIKERTYSNNIIQGSPSLIVGINLEGQCTFANPSTLRVIQYSREEIIGENWWTLMYPEHLFEQVNQLMTDFNRKQAEKYETTLTRKDGLHRIISWNSIHLLDGDGHVIEIIGFGQDITELKQAQNDLKEYAQNLEKTVDNRTEELASSNKTLVLKNEQLKRQEEEVRNTLQYLESTQKKLYQADKMASLGILVAGVGHEINNPLNFIKGGVQALSNICKLDQLDRTKATQFFNVINEGVDRVSNIVKSLSHFSRTTHTANEECNIHSITDNCLIILHNKTKHRIEIIKAYNTDNPTILGNEGKLHQAILNVISNAEQAIEEKGTITISTNESTEGIRINITDTGKGIAKKNLPKISDPFFTTKSSGKGTGLGLSITYSIIEEHHGHIEIDSTLGKGTTFSIILPFKS